MPAGGSILTPVLCARQALILFEGRVVQRDSMNASRIDPHGLYRAKSIVRPRKGDSPTPAYRRIPGNMVGRSQAGRFPKPIKIGRCTMWRGSDLLRLPPPGRGGCVAMADQIYNIGNVGTSSPDQELQRTRAFDAVQHAAALFEGAGRQRR